MSTTVKPWWRRDWTCTTCGAPEPRHSVATTPTAYVATCSDCLPAVLQAHGYKDLEEGATAS